MKFPVLVLLALSLVLTGCGPKSDPAAAMKKAAIDSYLAALDDASLVSQTKGRYQFHSKELVLLDTATGKTYMIDKGKWRLLPEFPGAAPISAPEQAPSGAVGTGPANLPIRDVFDDVQFTQDPPAAARKK